MNESMNIPLVKQWMKVLIYTTGVSLVNSISNALPFVPSVLTLWISRGVLLVITLAMFKLAPVNVRYRKSGILRAAMLACTIILSTVSNVSILSFAASILSVIAIYQEYSAHSELVEKLDGAFSRNWHRLFNWNIFAGILMSIASVIAVMAVAMVQMDAELMTDVIVAFLGIPQMILDLVYITYMRRMMTLISCE